MPPKKTKSVKVRCIRLRPKDFGGRSVKIGVRFSLQVCLYYEERMADLQCDAPGAIPSYRETRNERVRFAE